MKISIDGWLMIVGVTFCFLAFYTNIKKTDSLEVDIKKIEKYIVERQEFNGQELFKKQ